MTQHKLREFIGLINFYHRFLPHAAQILQSLYKLLTETKDGPTELCWTSNVTAAFVTIKEALANARLFLYPEPDAPAMIMCDVSDSGGSTFTATH